jgi:hypothetical protein
MHIAVFVLTSDKWPCVCTQSAVAGLFHVPSLCYPALCPLASTGQLLVASSVLYVSKVGGAGSPAPVRDGNAALWSGTWHHPASPAPSLDVRVKKVPLPRSPILSFFINSNLACIRVGIEAVRSHALLWHPYPFVPLRVTLERPMENRSRSHSAAFY